VETSSRPARLFSIWSAHWPVISLLLIGLILGLWLGKDYGLSLDEGVNVETGEQALLAYRGSGDYFSLPALADHGPAYFIAFVTTSRLVHDILPSWGLPDGRHLTNYTMFLVAVLGFYVICRRFLTRTYAWVTTVLFATQPLLFGHAFINQKDIPFMALFILSVAVGLAWLDQMGRSNGALAETSSGRGSGTAPSRWQRIGAEWSDLGVGQRRLLLGFCILACLLASDLWIVHAIENTGRGLIVAAFNGQAPPPIQRVFEWIATDAYKTPLDLYLAKYDAAIILLRQILPPVLIFSALVACSIRLPSFGETWGVSKKAALNPVLLASAALFGLAVCVRQVGALAGGLISLGVLLEHRMRAAFSLVVYWAVAACVTVATWPFLWPDPVGRMLESVLRVSSFPSHSVLFRGEVFSSANLPWTYFPTLAALELTEPVVVLVILGSVVVLWRRVVARGGKLAAEHAVIGLWGAVPPIGLLFFGMGVYGNIRQLLFALPPLFLLAGKGIEWIGLRLRFKGSALLLTTLIVLPGIAGIVRLHPYEYTYFNVFTGGVKGADGKYQLDSWCISYREAVEVVDTIAEVNATVLAVPQSDQVPPYLRSDLRLVTGRRNVSRADYAVTCTYRDAENWGTEDFEVVYQVEREGAIFAKVWRRVTVQ
jgi:hypothetical protein